MLTEPNTSAEMEETEDEERGTGRVRVSSRVELHLNRETSSNSQRRVLQAESIREPNISLRGDVPHASTSYKEGEGKGRRTTMISQRSSNEGPSFRELLPVRPADTRGDVRFLLDAPVGDESFGLQ